MKKSLAVFFGSAALVAVGTVAPATAGEVNGNQQPIPAPLHAHTISVL